MAIKAKAPRWYIRGVARYAKTDKAYSFDKAQKKSVPDPAGKLSLEVILSEQEAAKHIANVAEFAKEQGLKKYKNEPFAAEVDKETDEETGNVVFKAWQYGQSKDGSSRKMAHFDSKGKGLPSGFKLTNGSVVIMAVRPNAYKELGGGVNLYLDGVQVVKYREFDGNPGFGAVDDGEYIGGDEDEDDSGSDEDTADETDDQDSTDF